MKNNKANIVFIFTDQHRKDFLNCYGSEISNTPSLQQLAADGVVFDNAYTTCPVCTPARASIQTGLYPAKHGMQNNLFQPGCVVHELPDTPQLLSRQLENAGYSVGLTGKWHLGYGEDAYQDLWYKDHVVESAVDVVEYPDFYRSGSSLPTDLGYEGDDFPGHGGGGHKYKQYQQYLKTNNLEHVLGDNPQSGLGEVISSLESTIDHFLTNRSIHFIEKFKDRDKPFFFNLNYWGPHGPAYVPSKFLNRYKNMSFDKCISYDENTERKPQIHNVKRFNDDWASFEVKMRYHYAYNDYIDYEIGRLLDYLKENDLYDNSYIIFAADHGDSLGCHAGLQDKAFHMYEETISIPLIIKPPKGTAVIGREQKFVNTTDIYSTILDAAEIAKEDHERHGRSVLPLVEGREVDNWPETVVTECSGLAYMVYSQRMIRWGDYKYVFNCGDTDELYNLKEDPNELKNLVKDGAYKEVLSDMRIKLRDWLKEHNDPIVDDYWGIVENKI